MSKAKSGKMKGDADGELKPKLRFPEFLDEPPWTAAPLGEAAAIITEKAGESECIPMSITSGVGLVSQEEKFGQTIAGKSYKNYFVIQRDDFAYNKSATKEYPQGFIAVYEGDKDGAVPNSIFTCFRVDPEQINVGFLNYLFVVNHHGAWLRKYITVGGRAHGSLSIDDKDLLAMPIPRPVGESTLDEQQKIADCLSSLDELIAGHSRKLDALKAHKKGLMQQLFPREGETLPRLRFPEFKDAPEWEIKPLGKLFDTTTGGTPDRSKENYWSGDVPWITTSLVNFNTITAAEEFITEKGLENSSAKLFPEETILLALYGQGVTRGKVALLGIEASTNQACGAILPCEAIQPKFTFLYLCSRYEELRGLSNSGGQKNLSQGIIRELPFSYPEDKDEQNRIVDCLTSLNALVESQSEKFDALLSHKRGLMQQLFPSLDEAKR